MVNRMKIAMSGADQTTYYLLTESCKQEQVKCELRERRRIPPFAQLTSNT